MMLRRWISSSSLRSPFVLALAAMLLGATSLARAEDRPPNVVLIYCDDLGYGDLGCYGSPLNSTPHLDRLASEGMRFTQFYTAQAVCSASRVALLTGRYSNRVGILGALGPTVDQGIADSEWTLGEVFHSRGYATAIFGKWHLGRLPQFLPLRHGFDEYLGLPYSNDMGVQSRREWPDLPLIEGDETIETNPDQNQLTRRYAERAVAFIESHADKPFFLYLPHTMPHVPLGVSENFAGSSGRGMYADLMAEIDDSVGKIAAALDRNKLTDNTLVLFSSDNGPWLIYGDHAGSTGGLREGKGTTFEGGVRVPLIARWPAKIAKGVVCDEPLMTIDLLPTLAAAIGAEKPADVKHDGQDIRPILFGAAGAENPHEALYFFWGRELQALRSGRWKLHLPHDYVHLTQAGAGGRRGATSTEKIALSLFDLAADPQESQDVLANNPEVAARLQALAKVAIAEIAPAK